MKIPAIDRERKKRFRRLKRKSKKIAARIKQVVISSPKFVYRCARDHPFLASMVLFLFLLHAFLPSLFWFLVSSSPILICTALLLGTLLSFGQPHIPEIEEEETKTDHDVNLLQVPPDSAATLQKEISSDSDSESEDEIVAPSVEVGEPSEKVVSREIGSGVGEIRGRGFRTGKDILADILARRQTSEITESSGSAVAVEHVSRDLLKSREEDDLDLVHEESEPGTCHYTRLKPSDENDAHSDLGSDRSESASPDASMADINPMLDELCPFIPTNHADDSVLDNLAPPLGVKIDNSDSESLVSTQPHGSGYGSDEMEENIEETGEDKHGDGGVVWTADDEKNVMDLGSSEIERNRRLENLMAKRRERQNLNSRDVDAGKAESRVQLPSISTRRSNPFADDSEVIRGLPPVPGSAPSILLQKSNPFDFSDKYFAESGNTFSMHQGDQYLEGFTVGASGSDSDFGMPQYFTPQERTYSKYQRQLSELGYPKLRSGFKPEPLYPLPDQEYHSDLLEQNLHEESEFISFTKPDDASRSAILEDENFAAPGATLPPIDVNTWNEMVSEPEAHTHFDALGVHNVPDVNPLPETVSTDGVQYESFTTLETDLDNRCATMERIFSFGSDEKLDSAGPRSDETIESDSSTECDESPMSEDPSDGMLPASHPSIDEPVVLPLELSILPEIAEKMKAESELEQQHGSLQVTEEPREIPSDASEDSDAVVEGSDGMIILGGVKEVVDEHILAELDVVGDFSVANLPGNDNQVEEGSQSDRKFESEDGKNLNLIEPVAYQSDHEVKLEVAGSSSKEDKEVEAQSGPKDAVSELHVIEASCLDDIDLALMHAEGYVLDSTEDAQSEQVDHQSDLHEIKVRSLDELLEVLGNQETPRNPTSISSNAHEEESLGLHEISVGSLDELHEVLGKHDTPRKPTSTSLEVHEAESPGLHEISVGSLDELHEVLGKLDTPRKPTSISSEVHEAESLVDTQSGSKDAVSELHVIEARCLDDIDLALMHAEGYVIDSTEDAQSEQVDHQSDLHEIKVRSLDELHEVMGKQATPRKLEAESLGLHEISVGSLDELNEVLGRMDTPQKPISIYSEVHEAESLDLHEISVGSLDELHEVLGKQETPRKPSLISSQVLEQSSDLHEISVGSLDELHEVLGNQGTPQKSTSVSTEVDEQSLGLHEISAGSLVELHEALGKQDTPRKPASISSDVHEQSSDLHEISAGSLDELHDVLGKQDTPRKPSSISLEVHKQSLGLHEINVGSLDELHEALGKHETPRKPTSTSSEIDEQSSGLHEISVGSLDELHEVLGKQETPRKPISVSSEVHETESPSLHEISVGSLDELHEALSKQATPRKSTLIPSEEHDVEPLDLHSCIVGSLDDLAKQAMPQKPAPISSEQHGVESTDMHDIEVQSHDEPHSPLGKQVTPPDSVDTTSEEHVVEDQNIQKNSSLARCEEPGDSSRVSPMLHEIGAGSFKELHAAMFNPVISSGSLDAVDSVDEAEAQIDTDYEKVPSSLQESAKERIVSDLQPLEDLHPIPKRTDSNAETAATSSNRPDIRELHEIEVGTLEDLHAVLKK